MKKLEVRAAPDAAVLETVCAAFGEYAAGGDRQAFEAAVRRTIPKGEAKAFVSACGSARRAQIVASAVAASFTPNSAASELAEWIASRVEPEVFARRVARAVVSGQATVAVKAPTRKR